MADRLKFYWSEHETTAHSTTSSATAPGYAANYSADVKQLGVGDKELASIIGPTAKIWEWSVEYDTDTRGVNVRATGYSRTMEAGKLAAENACNRVHAAFLPTAVA